MEDERECLLHPEQPNRQSSFGTGQVNRLSLWSVAWGCQSNGLRFHCGVGGVGSEAVIARMIYESKIVIGECLFNELGEGMTS